MFEKSIDGFPGYSVTSDGDVRREGNKVSTTSDGRGYLKVFAYNENGEKKSLKIHRIVALAFIKNPDNLPVVNHIDGDKHNNRLSNLEWVTFVDNTRKFHEKGSISVKPIVRINAKTGTVKEVFNSIRMAAKYLNCDYRTLFDAVKRGAPYKGYLYRYCDLKIKITLGEGETYEYER
jgi:hypothetical protein